MKAKVFNNLDPKIKPKGFIDFLKWQYKTSRAKWPKSMPITVTDIPPAKIEDNKIRVSFVGHATFLIQVLGLNILTDPIWSARASPFSFIGPKRVTPAGINFADLPKIDIVLISHNHYDHMDIPTIKKLWQRDKPQIITPLMNDTTLKSHISEIKVTTLDWEENITITNSASIYLEPAQHWSARGLFDRNKSLWGTFIIKTSLGSICFIGDSGYSNTLFKDIGDKHKNILLSLIPIGAFEPRWFMRKIHMNPEEAVLVHQDLRSKYSIASHFETFQLADDQFDQAAKELAAALIKYKVSSERFITPKAGNFYWFSNN